MSFEPYVVTHACNLSSVEAETGVYQVQDQPGQLNKTILKVTFDIHVQGEMVGTTV